MSNSSFFLKKKLFRFKKQVKTIQIYWMLYTKKTIDLCIRKVKDYFYWFHKHNLVEGFFANNKEELY